MIFAISSSAISSSFSLWCFSRAMLARRSISATKAKNGTAPIRTPYIAEAMGWAVVTMP